MKSGIFTKMLVPFLMVILVSGLVLGTGCKKAEPPPPTVLPANQAPSTTQLSSTLVPNVPMDIYLYSKQDSPTRIPLKNDDPSSVMNVESVAVWGVPGQDKYAFGIALTLTNTADAKKIDSMITAGPELWKLVTDKVVYVVSGSGTAAEALKTAISKNDFKNYADEKGLAAAARMPAGGQTKLGAIALIKPSPELISYISRLTGSQSNSGLNTALGIAQLEVVAAGIYAPQQIDGVNMVKASRSGGAEIFDQDLGILVLAKSGLPGIVVGPAIPQFLKQYNFVETKIGEVTVYKMTQTAGTRTITIMVRVEGNSIFAAVSGKEAYAQTLITNIVK